MSRPIAPRKEWSTEEPAPKHAKTTPSNFYQLYMRWLVGCTIKSVGQDGEGFLRFVAVHPSGHEFTVEVACDEEGNAPGFLHGLPNPYDLYD